MVIPVLHVVSAFFFPEADLKIRDILKSERGGILDKGLTHAVLSENVRLIREHGHNENTVDTTSGFTVVHDILSPLVCVPYLYSSASSHVA